MGNEIEEAMEGSAGQEELDPWSVAFAAIDKAGSKDEQGAGDGAEHEPEQPGGEDTDGDAAGDGGPADAEQGHGMESTAPSGELDLRAGADSPEDAGADSDMLGVSEQEIEAFRNGIREEVGNRAIDAVAKEFIKRGVRNTNGKLGATINDPDICKRDSDGVPSFYNPDTGREFSGDNPRRQAQEWVDDYNKELAKAFNTACEKYSNKLMQDEAPQIAVLEFANTYDQLDPIRQSMFDNLVEDYEIVDGSGNVIGYSCDLNKALAAVDRQIGAIQSYARQQSQSAPSAAPTSPAVDMKNSAGAMGTANDTRNFKSLEDALLYQQNQMLDDLKKKSR